MSRVPSEDARIDTAQRWVAALFTAAVDKRKPATFTKKTIYGRAFRRIQPDNEKGQPCNTAADHGLPPLLVKLPTAIM